MKSILTSIAAGSLLAALAIAQPAPRYTITDLVTLGGTFNQATFLNNHGLVTGLASLPDSATQHAVLWYKDRIMDIAKPGPGGLNSGAVGVNKLGQVELQAETSTALDPSGEDFCGYGTHRICLPFVWQNGVMTQLPTGGHNGGVGMLNNRGEVSGWVENSTQDPKCLERPLDFLHPFHQVLDFEAVIWGPGQSAMRKLLPLHFGEPGGDTVGMAFGINDNGQAVGSSGLCSNTVLPPIAVGPHAVLWEKDGSVHDLGNFGGTVNTALTAVGNIALAINNHGQVTGASALFGNTTAHAFLWTRETGMQPLGAGKLPGDIIAAGLAINDRGDVVGASSDAGGNPRVFLWQSGVMRNLQDLVVGDSPLYLLVAFGINDVGQIAGFGATSSGEIHGFLATPVSGVAASQSFSATSQSVTRPMVLPERAHKLLRGHLGTRGW